MHVLKSDQQLNDSLDAKLELLDTEVVWYRKVA